MATSHPHGEPRLELDSLIYSIHAATDGGGEWFRTLELLHQRFAGRLATLARHHFATGQGEVLYEFPGNPRFRAEYSRYASRNPWFLSSEEFRPGRVITGNELLSNYRLVKTDFYRDLLKPHGLFHCLSGVAVRHDQYVHFVSVYRGDDAAAYGEREKASLRLVLTHIALALKNRWRLRESVDLTRVLMKIAFRHHHPSLLVDADGRIVHCNRSAAELKVPQAGLCIDGERLVAEAPIDRAALREAIRDVAESGKQGLVDAARVVTLSFPGARHPTVVSVHAAGQVFRAESGGTDELVLVTARSWHLDQGIHSCSFVKQYGLSPAQARLSVLIVTGYSLTDAAQKLRVSENTARSHLKQVFQKTNTHGQMELVHLHARSCVEAD